MSFSLNQAGTSWPKPQPVRDAVQRALASSPADWGRDFAEQHARVAAAFGLGEADKDRLVLTPGATSALAALVADLPWRAGDRCLHSAWEHHALHRPLLALEGRGVAVETVGPGGGAALDVRRLREELGRGGVRLVALTWACNVTGDILPVREIIEAARGAGALVLVDGAQMAGWAEADLIEMGVDLFAAAGHKGLQAPWGIGIMYARRGVVFETPGAVCDLPAPGQPRACGAMPGYCDVGSVDRAALAGLCAGLEWLQARPQRLAEARARVEVLAAALERRPAVTLLGMRDGEQRVPSVAFLVEGKECVEVRELFASAGIFIGSGLQCAPLAHETLGTAPGGCSRLSVGPSHSDAEVERALAVIAQL